jgi:hypothetical protein
MTWTQLTISLLLAPLTLQARAGQTEQEKARAALEKVEGVHLVEGEGAGRPVVGVRLGSEKFTAAHLAPLKHFKNLERVGAYGARINDSALAFLLGLKRLRSLELGRTGVGDAALKYLQGFGQLRVLGLSESKVTNAGLVRLGKLTKLRRLDLGWTGVGDAGLTHLKGMTLLQMLDLRHTKVTSRGLAKLPRAKGIRWVNVSKSKVTLPPSRRRSGPVRLKVRGTTAQLSDVVSGKRIGKKVSLRYRPWPEEKLKVTCWAFSNDGKWVVIGWGFKEIFRSGGTNIGGLGVWDTTQGKLIATSLSQGRGIGSVQKVAFLKDGKTVVFQAERWDIDGP